MKSLNNEAEMPGGAWDCQAMWCRGAATGSRSAEGKVWAGAVMEPRGS